MFGCVKLIQYWVSTVDVVLLNPSVGLLPRIKISFPLLSICTDEFISAPKIITFLPMLPSGNENSERESNHMPQPLYLYLYRSAFLVSFTDPNKQLRNVKSVFKSLSHGLSV